jgi:hypothetical protein
LARFVDIESLSRSAKRTKLDIFVACTALPPLVLMLLMYGIVDNIG